jgi:hypothetical protein
MVHIFRFTDFKKTNSLFAREHDKIVRKYDIDFISLKGVKMPLMCLYEIVLSLFENNSIKFRISNIILLTLCAVGILSKENEDTIKSLKKVCQEKNIFRDLEMVVNTIKSIKNLINIVLKTETVIQNIEQALKYKYSIDILNIMREYIRDNKITIKDFSQWYISDQRNKPSADLINYVRERYYDLST